MLPRRRTDARVLLSLVAACSLAGIATARQLPADPSLGARLIELSARIEEQRQALHVPGVALAIVKDGEVAFAQGFGLADVEGGRPVTPLTLFAIGSTTKAFTTTLISMLAEERRLGWDDPVTWYLPWFELDVDVPEGEDATVTLTDLVSHRTGFSRMGMLWAGGQVPREEFLRTATKAEPVAAFRKEFHYNNVMYVAAAEAASATTGRSWEQLVRRRLLRPLDMRHTSLSIHEARRSPRLALGYSWNEESGEFEHLPMRDITQVGPAGSINSNVVDMSRWLRFLLARGVAHGKRLLSAEALEANWQPLTPLGEGHSYGRGWFVRKWKDHVVVEHGGNIDGFGAQVTLFPEDDVGYVLLTNVTATPLQQLSINLVGEALLGVPAEDADDSSFDRYLGEYIADFGPFDDARFTVLVQSDKLAVDVPGQMIYELEPPDDEGKRSFSLTDQIAVSFETDDSGRAVLIRMYQAGLTFELPLVGHEPAPTPATDEVMAALGRYLGTYRSEALRADVQVLLQNGRLAIDVPGQMVFELEEPDAEGRRPFRAAPVMAAAFVEDGDGVVAALELLRDGVVGETLPRRRDVVTAARAASIDDVRRLRRTERLAPALTAMGTTRIEGSIRFVNSGVEGRLTETFHGTDHRRSEVDLGRFGRTVTVARGDSGEADSAYDGQREIDGIQLQQFRLEHPAALCGDWWRFFDAAEVKRESTLDGRAVHVVSLRSGDLDPWTVHVDVETGDVLQATSTTVLPRGLGKMSTTTRFSDFRDVSGIRWPHRIVADGGDATGRVELAVTDIRTGGAFTESVFRLPRVR